MNFYHAKTTKDNRCIDLLLTEEEVIVAFKRSLDPNNKNYFDENNCGSCWNIEKPPKCNFWSRILGICSECES